MSKDKKHAKTCAHCAFWEAHNKKYPDWEKTKEATGHYEVKAFNSLMLKAIQVAAEASVLLSTDQKAQFIMSIIGLGNAMSDSGKESEVAAKLFDKLVSENGWTRH